MKRITKFITTAALAAQVSMTIAASKPNIVLILIDDMGYGDIGPYGETRCKTPALDRMASEGLKFTSFYAAPVCSASRAQIMTGCYAPRVSIPGVLFPGSEVGLNPSEVTVAELLRKQGYATMCVGKWHLGDQPEFFPTNYGFDHYFGIPYSNDMMRPKVDSGEKVVPLMRDNQVVELMSDEDQERLVQIYTEEAVKFIMTNKEQPFFLYLPHSAVHLPIHPGPEFKGHSGNGLFYDWVEECDWSVGRVLETLRELNLDKNTLVIFTSDNGPWLNHGADAGTAGPLRGGKGSTWEGGVRVPTIAWWPGQIQTGRVTDAVAGEIDLLPTFVALAKGTVPQDRIIDGADISKILIGNSDISPREAHYYYKHYDLDAVRSGQWKLALKPQQFSMGFKDNSSQFGVHEPGLRLYNLKTDIGETKDVSAQYPEIVSKLKTLADKMGTSLCDGSENKPGVRAPGYVTNPKFLYPLIEKDKKKVKK